MFIFSHIFTYFDIVIWMISKFMGAHNPGLFISIWFTACTKVMSLRAKLIAGAQGLRELYAAWHGRVAAARGENGATVLQLGCNFYWDNGDHGLSFDDHGVFGRTSCFFPGKLVIQHENWGYQMAIVRHSQMESNGGVQGWVIALQGCVARNRWGNIYIYI